VLTTLADPHHHSGLIAMESLETVAGYSHETAAALRRALEEAGPATQRRRGFAMQGDPLGATDPDVYVWGREGPPEAYQGPECVAYGHWDNAVVDERGVHPRIVAGRSFGLDTISHGVLTALRFPGGATWQGRCA
jgi:hypothetical protein